MQPLLDVRKAVIEAIGSSDDSRCLLQAIVCGYRRNMSQTALYLDFQSCGLAHLVAVSGAHLVIVTGLLAQVLRTLHCQRRIAAIVLMAFMAAYLVIAGLPLSAIRATIMSSVGVLSILGKRRPSSLNALGLGIFAIVGTSPSAAVSPSFALSALSTAGIVLFSPLLTHWLRKTPLWHAGFVVDALSLTFAANILSQPYACSLFNQLPLAGPLANVLTAPLFPCACAGGLIASMVALLVPPAAQVALLAASAPAQLLSLIVHATSGVPYASIPVSLPTYAALAGSVGVAAALWAFWPVRALKPRVAGTLAVALVACAVALCPLSLGDEIVMLDIGQGDAFLIRSKGQSLLIDTGNHDSQLLEQLGRCATVRLDGVLLTHSDDDHVGSLDALQRAVDVDRIFVARDMVENTAEKNVALLQQARRTAREIVGLSVGDEFSVGSFTARVLWPESFQDNGGNADSLCLLVSYDGDADGTTDFTALFTGDAETGQIADILQREHVANVDILKAGHHGSREGLTRTQAQQLQPRIALICVGANNRYGHPAQETLDILQDVGCTVYRTDLDGQVKCSFTPRSVAVVLQ